MITITTENKARYEVATLLYRGKFCEAEAALTTFVHNGVISKENEVFYRFLLNAAHSHFNSTSMEAGLRER